MSWTGVITDAGRSLIAQYAAGEVALNVNKLTVGSGTVATENMRSATGLQYQRDVGAITRKEQISHGVDFSFRIGAGTTSSYKAREIGLWANVTDNDDGTLLALFQNPDGVDIPYIGDNPEYCYILTATLAVDNLSTLTITVDSSIFVTHMEYDPKMDEIDAALAGKVDKEIGKGLSHNDYTDADKSKLDGIEAQANKYVLPPATASTLGGVKVGTGLAVDGNGVLTNSAVRSVTTGTANGTVKVNTDGTAVDVPVKGLGSAAYRDADSLANKTHTHAASDVTSGTLPIARGGTGMTSNPSGLVKLNSESAADLFASAPRPGVTGTLPVSHGGTGVTSNPSMTVKLDSESAASVFSSTPKPGVTGVLPIAHGGTGRSTSPKALVDLASESSVDILTGTSNPGVKNTLPIGHGGTGMTSNPSLLVNLGSASAANVFASSPRPGVTGTLPIGKGGTGMTDNPSMLTNLGSTSAANVFASSPRPGVTGTLPIANGGTGATSASAARTNLGAAAVNHTHAPNDITGFPKAIGYFQGNGSTQRKIDLGFTPSRVLLFCLVTKDYCAAKDPDHIVTVQTWPETAFAFKRGENIVMMGYGSQYASVTSEADLATYFALGYGGCAVTNNGFYVGAMSTSFAGDDPAARGFPTAYINWGKIYHMYLAFA